MGSRKQVGFHRALIFCVIAFTLAWAATLGMRLIGAPLPAPNRYRSILDAMSFRPWFALCAFAALLPPALAIILAGRWETRITEWGLRTPRGLIVLLAPMVALAIQLTAIALTVGSGIGRFDATGTAQIERLTEQKEYTDAWETEYELQSTMNPALRRMVVGVIAGLVIGAAASPIIEIAWRGLLYTELRWIGFARCSLLVGVLAAAWWVPCLIMAPMAGAQTLTAGVRLAALALLGVPLAWLREATRSIIPGAVLVTSWVALLELPPMMVLDASDLQTALTTFTATGLLAGAALMRPPAAIREPDEEAQEGE